MNIFLLSASTDPQTHFYEQAAYHCDKHVIKMIAESTQLIITGLASMPNFVHHLNAAVTDDSDGLLADLLDCKPSQIPCKPLAAGHAKHPCAIWAASKRSSVFYLARLALALCEEKRNRWPLNPQHQYEAWLRILVDAFHKCGFEATNMPSMFPVAVQNPDLQSTSTPHAEAVRIYRRYYAETKSGMATWKFPRSMPSWMVLELLDHQKDLGLAD